VAALVGAQLRVRLRGLQPRPRPIAIDPLRLDVLAGMRALTYEPIRAGLFAARYLELALAAGEPVHAARALAIAGLHATIQAPRGAWSCAARGEAAARAAATGDPIAQATVELAHALLLQWRGEMRASLRLLETTETLLRERASGMVWELDSLQLFRFGGLMYMGAWRRLVEEVPAWLEQARARGDLYAAAGAVQMCGWVPHLARDDVPGARAELAEAMAAWGKDFRTQEWYRVASQVAIELYAGDGDAAYAAIRGAWAELRRTFAHRLQMLRPAMHSNRAAAALAAAAAATGRRRRTLLRDAERHIAELSRHGLPWVDALHLPLRAATAALRGDTDTAAQLLERAEAAALARDLTLRAAAARHRRGRLLGGSQGSALRASADAVMTAEGIAVPARVADLFVPGFPA
jgi:hypothetical protein